MEKKQKLLTLAGMVCLVVTLSLVWSFAKAPQAKAAQIKLVIAEWEPAQARVSAHLKEWIKELEEKSGGKVTGKISFGAMGPPPKYYDLAMKGIAHVSFVAPPYTPGKFPMSEVMQLPLTGEVSCETFSKAYWELYKKGYFDKEFKDVKVLYLGGLCPYDLHMTKGNDVRKLSDIKGKKIRASGAMHTKFIKAFGGSPVGMPAPEIPIAMQKGTIDGQFQFQDFITAFRTDQVTSSITKIGVSSLTFATVMNKKMWEKMPPDIKAIVDEISPKYCAFLGRLHDDEAKIALNMLKKAGAQMIELPPPDMKKIGRIVAPMWEEWIAEKEAKGLPGKKIVVDLYSILKGMGVKNPFHGYTP